MNRLFILRHAKAGQHTTQDHDRPLTEVGKTQAQKLGQWFSAQGIVFDAILTSSSLRTVETVEGLGLGIGFTIVPRLYSAPMHVIESVIRESGIESGTILVVAHNPGVSELVAQAGYIGVLSTCAVVELDVPGVFTDFAASQGSVVTSFRPEV
jgi:phosphohistidine phosphatase